MTSTFRTVQHRAWTIVLGLLMVSILLMVGGTARAVQVQSKTTMIHTVEQGQAVEGIVTLRSTAASPEWVRLYLTDYSNDARTGWQYPEAGTLPRSCAPWVDLMQTEVLLQPGEVRNVFYRVVVPAQTETQGTYWCALMIEPHGVDEDHAAPQTAEDGKLVLAIRHVIRYQLSLIVNVGNTGERALGFAEPVLETTDDGSTSFQVLVENTGQRWLNPVSWLEVYDDLGQLVGRVESPRTRILPGVASRRSFDLTGLDAGEYQALLLVDDGDDAVFGTVFALHLVSE
jgi:hypothetical protein